MGQACNVLYGDHVASSLFILLIYFHSRAPYEEFNFGEYLTTGNLNLVAKRYNITASFFLNVGM